MTSCHWVKHLKYNQQYQTNLFLYFKAILYIIGKLEIANPISVHLPESLIWHCDNMS